MPHQFAPGDDLIFQLESGLGLLRILAIEGEGPETVWHLLAYQEFFPSVEAAEAALDQPHSLHIRHPHMALTDCAVVPPAFARMRDRLAPCARCVYEANAVGRGPLRQLRRWEKTPRKQGDAKRSPALRPRWRECAAAPIHSQVEK